MDKVTGIVQAVGTKFNGSLKVNDAWHNLGKGVKNTAKSGDQVTLKLEAWESNGKRGFNVVTVDVLASKPATQAAPAAKSEPIKKSFGSPTTAPKAEMSKDEWAAKDRRISRQGIIQVAVQVTSNFDKAVELANKMLAFVNE